MIGEVETIGPDDDPGAAAERMLSKRIGCLPVVEEGRLVGLLSESDCMRYLVRLLDIAEVRKHLPELASPEMWFKAATQPGRGAALLPAPLGRAAVP